MSAYLSQKYIKRHLVTFLVVCSGLLGTVSALVGIFASSTLFFPSVLLCVALSVGFILLKYPPNYSIPADLFTIEMEKGKTAQIHFPCDRNFFKATNQLAKESFGKDTVNMATATSWMARNPFILVCLSDMNKYAGYFDLLPLSEEFYGKMIRGEAGEKDIAFSDVLDRYEMRAAEYVYFSGIAVTDPSTWKGRKHGALLVTAALDYFESLYDLHKIKRVLTIPVSDCGKALAERLGFKLAVEGSLRKDHFDLFVKDFNYHEFKSLKKSLAGYDKYFDSRPLEKFKSIRSSRE